jgi:hypothetical protein
LYLVKWHWDRFYRNIVVLICHCYIYFLLYSYSLIECRRYVLRATLNQTKLLKELIFTYFMIVYICSCHIAYIASYNLFVSNFLHETTLTLPYEFEFSVSTNSMKLHIITILCIVTYNNSKQSKKKLWIPYWTLHVLTLCTVKFIYRRTHWIPNGTLILLPNCLHF